MLFLRSGAVCLFLICIADVQAGGFVDQFDSDSLPTDPTARERWTYMTGDGEASMSMTRSNGTGLIEVDARADSRNIWWAFIRHSVSEHIDGKKLARPGMELRVEAKIRVSHAPRRVNLHFNHSRTTDFHSHLMEYDIPDADSWHVISLTTNNFDARPDDEVFVQMALMDWGLGSYSIELDYLKVSVVDPLEAGPDLGEPLPYRPANPVPGTLSTVVAPVEEGVIDLAHPAVNLGDWVNRSDVRGQSLLAVGGSLVSLLRWDLSAMSDCVPNGWGVLELTTEQVYLADTGDKEFGELRMVEVIGGDPYWSRDTVTAENFLAGRTVDTVLNGQMIIDVPPAQARGDKTLISVSPPVLRRLLAGRTAGLAIYSQGTVYASFYSGATSADADRPKLYLNFDQSLDGCEEKMQ